MAAAASDVSIGGANRGAAVHASAFGVWRCWARVHFDVSCLKKDTARVKRRVNALAEQKPGRQLEVADVMAISVCGRMFLALVRLVWPRCLGHTQPFHLV